MHNSDLERKSSMLDEAIVRERDLSSRLSSLEQRCTSFDAERQSFASDRAAWDVEREAWKESVKSAEVGRGMLGESRRMVDILELRLAAATTTTTTI